MLDSPPSFGRGLLERVRRLSSWPAETTGGAEPLRAELLSVEQLRHHFRTLARWHRVEPRHHRADPLLGRLNDNLRVLAEVHRQIAQSASTRRRQVPAAEWLLDNHYLVGEHAAAARQHFPRSYDRQLPKLANGALAGYARAYALTSELVQHVDARVDLGSIEAAIGAYQEVTPLKLGELWSIPIMLRLALIENVRRIACRVAVSHDEGVRSELWARRLLEVSEQRPADLVVVLAELSRSTSELSAGFVTDFVRRIRQQHQGMALVLSWIEQRLGEHGATIDQLVQAGNREQTADQVSVGHSITSLRALGTKDWRGFVEAQSVVDRTLRMDPAGLYADMAFRTRDDYRHAVEELARSSPSSEHEVAQLAVTLARGSQALPSQGRRQHVGWWLVDGGVRELAAAAHVRRPPGPRLAAALRRRALPLCLIAITAPAVAVGWWAALRLMGLGWSWPAALAGSLPPAFLATQVGTALVHWLSSLLVPSRALPRLDFSAGVPDEARTLVVVPCLLSDAATVDALLEAIEVHWVGNHDANIGMMLLSDLPDAPAESMPEDAALIARIRNGIVALNSKWGDAQRPHPFGLLHRSRRLCAGEGRWIGWERKRGKLMQLAEGLRQPWPGALPEGFQVGEADRAWLMAVRSVVVIDADTQLPMGSVRQLSAALAHPLNRPLVDAARRVVTDGHGLLQPRLGTSLSSASRSWYARVNAVDPGVDTYSQAVSDTYQDLFDQGSYVGKGIFDVDTFLQVLARRTPEGRILSHDLLEGCYVRSGLLSDLQLIEEAPPRYLVDSARRHRWVRGDWQNLSWLRRRVPLGPSGRERNPLDMLSQWKLFDNLRRSLMPVAILAMLAGCWWLGQPRWLLLPLLVWLLPLLTVLVTQLVRRERSMPLRDHLAGILATALARAPQAGVALVMTLHEALVNLDAIARTLWRLGVSRRHLLEWKTSAAVERERADLPAAIRSMAAVPVVAALAGLALAWLRPAALPWAAPLLAAWLVSPLAAWWLGRQPERHGKAELGPDDRAWLRLRARRTWRWFETFPSAEHHFLPPDNFQEFPVAALAARTSSTNIGLHSLCQLAACDFGWLAASELVARLEQGLTTLERLERYRGHFYNWYDTRTLRPLPPHYVSTVDSGNLVGCLLVLSSGLDELPGRPAFAPELRMGLVDALRLALAASAGEAARPLAGLERRILAEEAPRTLRSWMQWTRQAQLELHAASSRLTGDEARWWATAGDRLLGSVGDSLSTLAPWLALPPPPLQREALALAQALVDIGVPGLSELAALPRRLAPLVARAQAEGSSPAALWAEQAAASLAAGAEAAERLRSQVLLLAERCRACAKADFSFLLDRTRNLFSIGYNVTDHRLDESYYDLLASEARLASFIAVAQGQVSQDHWFALGRKHVLLDDEAALLSWSGSMFEYLMPLLLMPEHPGSLLARTCQAVVARQAAYGDRHLLPWGISESGFNATDAQLNYQYRAFGVPGLGLKRGLGEDLVVAPYASAMALMVSPQLALANLRRLDDEGREGLYGFYEAIDYTPARLPQGQSAAVVRSWMAHHQGMILLALAYRLLERPMQRRFLAIPELRAADLLLQERVPLVLPAIAPDDASEVPLVRVAAIQEPSLRAFTSPSTPLPEVHLLANGRYQVMVSAAGAGFSRWKDLAVTRWREDWTRDCWGQFCYLRDCEDGHWWSAAYQPHGGRIWEYEAVFTQGRAEFKRAEPGLTSTMEIAVSIEDDVEVRRITLGNTGEATRHLDATTYAEVVLAPQAQDLAHPAFSNLFVQCQLLESSGAILCTRRPRSSGEKPPWLFHLVSVEGHEEGTASYETSRQRFIGPGRSSAEPLAMSTGRLHGGEGAALDPIIAIRRAVRIEPDATARFTVVTGIAESREQALALIERYREPRFAERVFEMAWTHSQVVLRQLGVSEAAAQAYGRLAGSVIYPTAARRASAALLLANRRGQSGLWGYGISGDLPIVVVRISDPERLDLAGDSAQAHAYWRSKGLAVDLVILVEDRSVYRQPLFEQVVARIAGVPGILMDRPAGVFVRRFEQIAEEDRVLLQAAARVLLSDSDGTLAEQVQRRPRPEVLPPGLLPRHRGAAPGPAWRPPERELLFANGHGGFTPDGREYVIITGPDHRPPAPWSNVLANQDFGTVVDEGGGGYTWSGNCHEFRLSTWHNDPVCRTSGEALYLRDDDTGLVWSPCPQPAGGDGRYLVRHGFGYSVWEHERDGIHSELTLFVATDAPAKVASLRLRNRSGRQRRLALAGFCELVLGESRQRSAPHVVTALAADGTLTARNVFSTDFPGRSAAYACSCPGASVSGDRLEFIGRNGDLGHPLALGRQRLSGRVGAGLDPCFALLAPLALGVEEEREAVVVLAAGADAAQAAAAAAALAVPEVARQALEAVWSFWKRTLGVVHLECPEPAVNLLVNGWLPYQVLSARVWARSGGYQSGGAYGFRDQLQDVVALLHAQPALVRAHLLRAAAHQFIEGDVLHWWHPPSERGVRTHISDDYLWLPWATAAYVEATGDLGVLQERVAFLEGPALLAHEDSRFESWSRSGQEGTLHEHCLRALRHGLRLGAHQLPLIGGGDWNDGMNRVGNQGRGESVWLGFFLCDVLGRFAEVCRRCQDAAAEQELRQARTRLAAEIDRQAWDGAWYLRAWCDDGTVLGGAASPECQIDSLPQSWSALAGATDPQRARQAVESACSRLVDPDLGIIRLFTPPFDQWPIDPGYIKGYLPGVRENGGQYTHAAVWLAMAMAELGEVDRAWDLGRMLLPVSHAGTPAAAARYQVEPYVVAADVYAAPPHQGRGGWSWYTGSAGWLYRLLVGHLIGVRLQGGALTLLPRAPSGWGEWRVHYRFGDTFYHIHFQPMPMPRQVPMLGPGPATVSIEIDGAPLDTGQLVLVDDRQDHQVRVRYAGVAVAPVVGVGAGTVPQDVTKAPAAGRA